MYQTRILNEKEISEFNEKYNTNYQSIIIKKRNNNYQAILDCSKKMKMYSKEVANYFI